MRYDKAKAETQANRAMAVIAKARVLQSVGTYRDYRDCLKSFAQYIKDNRLGDLRQSTREIAERYLNDRKSDIKQKTLDQHRQAIQAFFVAKGELNKGEKLEIVKSTVETKLESRAYTPEQVAAISQHQNERNALATQIAYASGLRAHELFTLRPVNERQADIRHYSDGSVKALDTKFQGRQGEIYTVVGKGGLIREVLVPKELANRLEERRLNEPVKVRDRTVFYQSTYDIAGGKNWSSSFSNASKETLGWSTGAHGLRHSYAQERMVELREYCPYEKALETVSQEMGHFREDITEVYLR